MPQNSKQQLAEILERIAVSLDIPDEVHEDAVEKYEQVSHWLEEQDAENGKREPLVYPQGSFALGTVTKPIDDNGEYDIDLVYERDLRKSSTTQKQLKEEAGKNLESYVEHLRESHRDAPTLEAGRRCWTLDYPDQFHMDILPAIPNDEGRTSGGYQSQTKILITDKDVSEWQHSNPQGYANWFREQMKKQLQTQKEAYARRELAAKGHQVIYESVVKYAAAEVPDYKIKTPLQRAIQLLKRHRDFYFRDDPDHRPVSIILTTLAARAYGDSERDNLVDALLLLIRKMPSFITTRYKQGKPVSWVANPVNHDENFADRWKDEEFPDREKKFKAWLSKAEEDFTDALEGGGIHKIIRILGSSLGEKVVKEAATSLGQDIRGLSEGGSLGMATGGAIVRNPLADGSTTPVRKHTFYGEEDKDSDS